MDIRVRWKIEAKHHDKVFAQKKVIGKADFDPQGFYQTRPFGMKKLLDSIGSVNGLRILDVGCGLGLFSFYFAAHDAAVYALDISWEALNSFNVPQNVIKLHAAAELLPLSDGTVDVIWGTAVLHHLDLRLAIPEFYRVLKQGGRCFFYEPLAHNPVFNLWRWITPALRTPTERPLVISDLQLFMEVFDHMEVRFYHLLASLPQAFGKIIGLLHLPGKSIYRKIQWLESFLAKGDDLVFRVCPFFQRYSQVMGIICTKA